MRETQTSDNVNKLIDFQQKDLSFWSREICSHYSSLYSSNIHTTPHSAQRGLQLLPSKLLQHKKWILHSLSFDTVNLIHVKKYCRTGNKNKFKKTPKNPVTEIQNLKEEFFPLLSVELKWHLRSVTNVVFLASQTKIPLQSATVMDHGYPTGGIPADVNCIQECQWR